MPKLHDSDFKHNGVNYYCGPMQREHMDLLPEPPKVIIDCGAYDGGDSLRYKAWFPQARVITIEPHPELAAKLRAIGCLEVHEQALSNHSGEADFYFGDNEDGTPGPSGSLYKVTAATIEALHDYRQYASTPIKVKVETLEHLAARLSLPPIDVLHIDGEGSEPDIVAGFGPLRPKLVLAEVHIFDWFENGHHTQDSFKQQMQALGYTLVEEGDYDILWKHADADA